eukprot:4091234-Amphidinium_carterae.1
MLKLSETPGEASWEPTRPTLSEKRVTDYKTRDLADVIFGRKWVCQPVFPPNSSQHSEGVQLTPA